MKKAHIFTVSHQKGCNFDEWRDRSAMPFRALYIICHVEGSLIHIACVPYWNELLDTIAGTEHM